MPFTPEQNDQLNDIQQGEQQFDPGGPKASAPKQQAKVVPLPIPGGPASPAPGPHAPASQDLIDKLLSNKGEGTSGTAQEVPANLPFQPKPGQDNALLRAQDQGFLKQLGITAGNLIPDVAADIINMVGQVGNIPGTIAGHSDYDAGKLGDAIRDPFGEVYRERPDKVFDPGDSAFWLQNIGGFVEGAASFVIPGELEASGLGKLGQLATEAMGAGKLGIQAARITGHALSAFSMGYLMSADAGKKVFDEAYKVNYDRYLRQGYDSQTADDQAKQLAAEGAARTVQIGTLLNGVLNLTALAPLFKRAPGEAIADEFRSGEAAIKPGETTQQWKQRLADMQPADYTDKYRGGLTSHGFQAFQVGLQGVNNEYAEKVGKETGTGEREKVMKNLDLIDDYFDKVTDQQGAMNMLSGLLGGLTQNILMDHIPLHRVIKIDPATNKPVYKSDPNISENGDKAQYQTQLVSARTRDIMNNRQYFSSIRDAVSTDIDHMSDLTKKMDAAVASGDTLAADRLRQELMNVGNLNAVTMGMTKNWQEVYRQIAAMDNSKPLAGELQPQVDALSQQINEAKAQQQDTTLLEKQLQQLQQKQASLATTTQAMQHGLASDMDDHQYKQDANEAIGHLKALQDIHDRIADRFAPFKGDPDMEKAQDHQFAQEANHYLLGKAIDKESVAIARDEMVFNDTHGYNNEVARHERLTALTANSIKDINDAIDKGDDKALGDTLRKYGVNAYTKADMIREGKSLVEDIKEMQQHLADNKPVPPDEAAKRDYPVDSRMVERKANLDQARQEHELQKKQLAELRSKRGTDKFVRAVQKNASDWQKKLDGDAAKDTMNLFLKQQDKASAARLDKNQRVALMSHLGTRLRDYADSSGRINNALADYETKLKALEEKKGFFKNFNDVIKKKELREKAASAKAELAHLQYKTGIDQKMMDTLQGHAQDAALKEQAATNATREEVEQDLHEEQSPDGATANPGMPTAGIPEDNTPAPAIPDTSIPPEEAYAALHATLSPAVQQVLDNAELVMPDDMFHRDLVHTALLPFVDSLHISEDTAHQAMETMREWWEDKASRMQQAPETTMPIPAPVEEEPVMADNRVSDIPEPDSPIITYSNAINAENLEASAPTFQELGAKSTNAMKVNSRSIEYMRVQKGNKLLFLPMYDKLDPNFNKNILKPNFVQAGDGLHFEVDTDWNGQVNMDKADVMDEYGMPSTRPDSFGEYTTPDGKIIMTKQAPDMEAPYANAPIKIVHDKSGQTIGYLPRVDWVTAKRADTTNYRNIEDTITLPDGTTTTGNVAAQRAKLLAVRAMVAQAHNAGRGQQIKTRVDSVSPGHVFLSTEVNKNTENSKMKPLLAKNLLPDKKLQFGILNNGTIMVGKGTPFQGKANFDEASLSKKYASEGKRWSNVPMVLLPMPNGGMTESPVFTRQLAKRPADIHTISKAIESYLAHGTAAETAEHGNILEKTRQHTGYDITTEKGLRSFINQYYTYTQPFNEVHTRSNSDTSQPKVPRFMLDIPDVQPGAAKAAIKVGTSFSGSDPVYALTRDGKINPEFDEVLRSGLETHYKNVVYTSPEIQGINDKRPITSITIQRDGKIRTEKHENYNEYLKTFASTVAYGLHRATDGSYLYGANPPTEFDFNAITATKIDTGNDALLPDSQPGGPTFDEHDTGDESHDDLIRHMMNNAIDPNAVPEAPKHEDTGPQVGQNALPKSITRDDLTRVGKKEPLTAAVVEANVNKLYDEAVANPEQQYHLDIPGVGKTRFKIQDGYMTHNKLAQILDSREIPYNIKLGDDIMSVLQSTPRRFLNSMMFENDTMYGPLQYDQEILGEQLNNTFVPVRDEQGNHTGGYFSPERQGEVTDSVVKAIAFQLDKQKSTKVGDLMKLVKNNVFANLKTVYDKLAAGEKVKGFDAITPDQAKELSGNFQQVLNSFEPHAEALSFWGEAMKKLDALGIRVRETKGNQGNDVLEQGDGTAARTDWFDDHFTKNPMDSASSRVKMFIATTTDSTIGQEERPRDVKLSFADEKVRKDIVAGKKLFTTRTPDQAKEMGLDRPGAEAITKVDGKEFRVTALHPIAEGDAHATQIGMEEGTEPKPGDVKLQLEPYVPKENQLTPNRNYLGLTKLADYEALYEDAMATLGDTPRNLEGYIAKLKDDGLAGKPNLFALAANLEKAGKQTQNEFVSVMTLHYQPFTMMLADTRTDIDGKPFYRLRPINANRASQLNVILDHWQQSQKYSPILEKVRGETVVNKKLAIELRNQLNTVNELYRTGAKEAPAQASELLRKMLEANGIVLPEKALEAFTAKTLRWTKKTSVAGDFSKQFAVTADGKPQGLVSSMILRLAGEGKEDEVLDGNEDKSFQLNNPLYTEGTAMKVLSRVAAAYTPNLYSNTHRSSEGKSIYDWGLPHKLSNDFSKLKNDDTWRNQFANTDFSRRSWLIESVSTNPELRDRASLSYLDGIRAAYGKQDSGTTRPDMSDREQLITSVGLFQNNGDSRYAHYLSLTHSDRSTTPVFMNMPRIPLVTSMRTQFDKLSGESKPQYFIHDDVFKRLNDVFLSEYDRINRVNQVRDYNDVRYEKGGQHFFILPQFNYDRMKEMVKDGRLTDAEFRGVWAMGEKKLSVLEGNGFKSTIDKMLQMHVSDLTRNTLKEWADKGILDPGNIPFDRKYLGKLLSGVGIYSRVEQVGDTKKTVYRTRDNQPVPDQYVQRLQQQLAARDYAINSFLFNSSLSQTFFGDPAQNWKGTVDKTMVEYGKRLTQFISPRKEGNWEKPTYTSITVKDFITKADYLGKLAEAYKDINATDAQEVTTVLEKLDVLKAYGRINGETYTEMKKIIFDAKGGYYEFTKPEHLAVVMQPEKPLYSGSRQVINGAILNDYVKSSAYALYPPLVRGQEMDKLRQAMEKGGVARMNFESAKKVGIPQEPVKLFDSNGKINEKVFDTSAWTGVGRNGEPVNSARQELSRDNFGLSQEVPYDEDKKSIRTVSQMNKLITEGIATISTPFDFQGSKLSGAELQVRKEDIRKDLIQLNSDKLIEKVGGLRHDKENGTLEIQDKHKLYDSLLDYAQSQGGYSPNDLAILQHTVPHTDKLIVPLMFSPSASKFESLVMSMVNGMTDVKMPGKSYVQASSAGYQKVRSVEDLSEEEKGAIVRVGDYNGGPLKMPRMENGEVKPAQVIVPWPYAGEPPTDLSTIPKDALHIVAARIPNSGHNLMLPSEIVGFVPKNMGDLALVPEPITRQMGSDFDVDKLYTYRRGYEYKPGEESAFNIPDDEETNLKRDYFDVHWSVLMHPEMLDKVLSPMDKEDLKDEAAQIEQWENKGKQQMSFYDPIYQLRDFQNQKDAKQLVGRSSLNVTFDAVIQDKDLQVGYLKFNPETFSSDPTSVPIEFIDEDGNHRKLTHLSGYGQGEYKKDGATTGEVRTKQQNHVMQQAEFLDYSKNKVSDKVHLTVHSYPASGALTQLQEADEGKPGEPGFQPGWAPSIKYNTRLLSQPIVQEYSQEMAKAQDTFSEGYDPDIKNTVIAKLQAKYLELTGDIKPEDAQHPISFTDLTDALSHPKSKDFALTQLKALQLFKQLEQVGTQMSTAQSTINQDVNGAGPNLLTTMSKDYTQQNLVLPLASAPDKLAILHADNLYIRKDDKPTEQGYLYSQVHTAAYGIAGGFFPYRDMKPMFDYVMEHTNRQELGVDTQKNIFNAMKSYLFSHPKLGLWEDPQNDRARLLYGGKEGSLATRVLEAKNTWGKNDLFLQRLQPDIDPDKLRPDYIRYQAAKITKIDQDENTRHWVDLLTSEDPVKAQLGHDLVRYSYLTGGIQDSGNFIKFLPYSFLIGTDFGHKLRELTNDLKELVTTGNFKAQVFQHNPQLAKTLSTGLEETGSTYEKYPERFTLPAHNPEAPESNPAKNLLVRVDDGQGKKVQTYPDFLSHRSADENRWILYKKMSLFNGTEEGTRYARIDTLGSSGTDEYSFSEGLPTRSLIPDNRSKAYDNIEPAFRMINGAIMGDAAKDVLREAGVPRTGGEKEMTTVLMRMALDKEVPEHSRVLSSWLSTLHGQGKSAADALSTLYNRDQEYLPKFNFKVISGKSDMSPWAGADMDSYTNTLRLREGSMADKGTLAGILNHELIHYHTGAILQLSEPREFQEKKFDGNMESVRFAESLWRDISERHPDVKQAVKELGDVREQVQDAIRADMLKRGRSFDQEYDAITRENKINAYDPWHKFIYASASNTEFIAHALTDKEFMQYMNKIQAAPGRQGVLDRIIGVVKKMMSAVATALGADVEKNSLLEHAIDKSMKLMVLDRAAQEPTREQMATPNNMEGMFRNAAIGNPTLTAMDRLAGKLQEQHDEINASLTGRLSNEEYADKRSKLDQIEKDIERLKQDQSFQVATEIGKRHLEWVDNVLAKDNPTPAEIMTSSRVLEVWSNLIPLVYGGGEGADAPDAGFAQLAADAQDKSYKWLRKAERSLVDMSSGTISMKDYSTDRLKDISKDQALMRDVVSAAGSKVTQYIGTHMQTTARQVGDEVTRLVKETRAMEEAIASQVGKKNLPAFYDKFFQENKKGDAWGLVQRYSQNWYDFLKDLRDKRKGGLKKIDAAIMEPNQAATMKKNIWDHYWKEIDKNAMFADTRKLFDTETGDLKDDDIAKAHRAELEKTVGHEAAQETIDAAQERYKKYLDRKAPYFDELDAQESAGTKTPEQVKAAKDEFTNRWSPNVFFSSRGDKLGTGHRGSDYYAKMAPRLSAAGFHDDKYAEIQKDPVASKFYGWIKNKLETLKGMLPEHVNDAHLGANFLPVVKKSLLTDMINIPEYVRTMGERLVRDISATPFEEQVNDSNYRRLPIDYVDKDEQKTPLETRSRDLPRVIEAFGMMAMHYKHFSEAKDGIDMGEAILQQLDQARSTGATQMEVGGKLVTVQDGLKNTLEALRYMKDYILYRKARKLEGKSDMMLYSLNPVKQMKATSEVKRLLAERTSVEEKFSSGEMDPEEAIAKLGQLNEELKQYQGTRIYGSKLGDKLITVNQLKTLSFNPFSGLANMTFGVVSAAIHANGARDFGWKDLGASLKIMMNSTAKWVTLGSAESATAEKILAVMDRTGVIGDIVDSHYGKISLRDNKAAWRHAINPYNWMRSGDYFMKGLTTVAMLLHDKVKVTDKGTGEEKTISMWEALDHEGKWDAAKYGENKGMYSEDVQEQKDWDKYRNKVVRVNMIIHGNQDKTSPKLANKYILGRLIGQFRMSWLPEGWYSRFQKEHFDIQLDREVKGRYRTIQQLGFGGYVLTTLKQAYSIIGKLDPYSGVSRLDGKPLSETDRENMRRNFAELGFVAGIMGMVVATRALASDTDDESTAARYKLLMNMLIRNKQDMEFYASPQVFDTVTRDIIPAANVLKDFGKAVTATGKLIFNDDYEFQKWLMAVFHAGLPVPQATLITKAKYMMQKDLDQSPY